MPRVSICPLGTRQTNLNEEDLKQNAFILFSGIIREAERNPAPKEGRPVWRLGIETYPFYFDLLYYKDEPVAPGNLVHGRAWLRGTMKRAEKE